MWQNLGVSAFSRIFRFAITYICILLLIGIGILGICFLKYYQKVYTDKYQNDPNFEKYKIPDILSFFIPLLINIINNILVFIVRRFSLFERHHTFT